MGKSEAMSRCREHFRQNGNTKRTSQVYCGKIGTFLKVCPEALSEDKESTGEIIENYLEGLPKGSGKAGR
jgi:hypothetical protein